jgi:hypothetical protein
MLAYHRSNRCLAYGAQGLVGFVEWAGAVAEGGAAVVPAALHQVAPHAGDAVANALGLVLGDGHVDVGGQIADHAAIGVHVDLGTQAGELFAGAGGFGYVAAETTSVYNDHTDARAHRQRPNAASFVSISS